MKHLVVVIILKCQSKEQSVRAKLLMKATYHQRLFLCSKYSYNVKQISDFKGWESVTTLTAKQDAFCREYLIDLNATQAAIRAGYSEKTAQAIGTENLAKPLIKARLQELISERNARVEIDADWVLIKAKESFEFNAQQVHDADGNPKMVNAAAASKFLELCGKHTKVKAFEAKQDEDKQEAQPLHITFDVRQPVGDVSVTNAKS